MDLIEYLTMRYQELHGQELKQNPGFYANQMAVFKECIEYIEEHRRINKTNSLARRSVSGVEKTTRAKLAELKAEFLETNNPVQSITASGMMKAYELVINVIESYRDMYDDEAIAREKVLLSLEELNHNRICNDIAGGDLIGQGYQVVLEKSILLLTEEGERE